MRNLGAIERSIGLKGITGADRNQVMSNLQCKCRVLNAI